MALSTVNAVWEPTGPTASNQIIVRGPGDVNIDVYRGHFQTTLDGSATTGIANWIDGVLGLPFTPSYIQLFRYLPPATGVVATVSATSGGTNYAVGSVAQLLQPTYGGLGATASVATITAGGVPATWTVQNPGNGNYFATSGIATATTLGSGSGATVTITVTAGQTADTAAATIVPLGVTSVSALTFNYSISAAGSNGNLLSLGFIAYK